MQAWNLVWRFFYMYVFNKDPGQPKIQDGNHSSRWLPQKYEICQVSIKSLISSPYFQIWVTLDVNHCRYVVYIPCRMKGTWDYCLNLSQKWKKWSLASLKSNTNIMPQFSFWKCISKYIFAFPTSKNMLYKRISYIIYGCTNINRLYHGWRLYIPGIVTRDSVLSRDPEGRGTIQVEGDYTRDVQPPPIGITFLYHA